MAEKNRVTPIKQGPFVVFIVGMRVNQLWAIHKWLPVALAMPRMIVELMKNRDLGLIGTPRTFVSGRLVQVQQYWTSYQALENFAGASENTHLPAWKRFNQASRGNTSVGIYHETYLVEDSNFEAIYVNLKKPLLLGDALGVKDIDSTLSTARKRLGR